MASSTITELEVLTAIISTDDKTIKRLINSVDEGKTVVGKVVKQCFRELLNRHIILTPSIFEFIQKCLIDCNLCPNYKEALKSNTNGQKTNRIKYTLYYMNEIAMHEGAPDELLWHNVQMAIACAHKVQHDVKGLPWRKLLNYLNIFQKQHLTVSGIDAGLVPKLLAIITCFRNALCSKQKISQMKTVFQEEWMNTNCEDYYWQVKDEDTVNKMIKAFEPLSELTQIIERKGCVSSIEFLGVLRVNQNIGELCKNTHTSPNMSDNLENIFSRYIPVEIKRHLIGLRDKIAHLEKYPKVESNYQDLVIRVIQTQTLLLRSIQNVKHELIKNVVVNLHEELFAIDDKKVFKDLLKLIDNSNHESGISASTLMINNDFDYYRKDMSILIECEMNPNVKHSERNKIAHDDDVPNNLKCLFDTDYFPKAEIKLLLDNNYNIRKRHIVQLNTKDNYKQSPLHIATIKNNISEVLDLLSAGTQMNELDIAGLSTMFYAIRSDSIEIFASIYESIKNQCTSNTIIALLLWAIKLSNIDVIDLVVLSNKEYIHSYSHVEDIKVTAMEITLNFAEAMNTLLTYKEQRMATGCNDINFLDLVNLLLKHISDINAVDSDGWTALHHASEHGNYECIELLINNKSGINAVTSRESTALHFASYEGHAKCVELLLNNKSDVNAVTEGEVTALHFASNQGHEKCIELLLNNQSDVNAVNRTGLTALHYASNQGHDKCVELLLKHISDINAVNSGRLTALHFASYKGHAKCVKLLLNYNPNINAVDSIGLTALHCASNGGHTECVELLLKNNADINAVDSDGWTALHCASDDGNYKCVELLVNNKSDVNAVASNGLSALHCASNRGHDKCVELLLKHVSDINAVDSDGLTALHFASKQGHDKCVELLLKYVSDINAVDSEGMTALHHASHEGHDKCVELLLKNKADINAVTFTGLTPLHCASYEGHYKCVELLLNNKSNINTVDSDGWTALHFASQEGNYKCVELLLINKCKIIAVDSDGLTPLHCASCQGHDKCVEILLSHNSDINAVRSDGWTALHCASEEGNYKCVELLVNNNSDINAVTSERYTPLHCASSRGHDKCVELLLNNKSNAVTNAVDSDDWTALHYASEHGNYKCVELILKHTSDINAVNSDGLTALQCASNQGHDKCVELLTNYESNINTV